MTLIGPARSIARPHVGLRGRLAGVGRLSDQGPVMTFDRLRALPDPDHLPALDKAYLSVDPARGLGPHDPPLRILLLPDNGHSLACRALDWRNHQHVLGQCSSAAITIYLVACCEGSLVCLLKINMTCQIKLRIIF